MRGLLGELEASMPPAGGGKLWNACEQMLVLIEPGAPQEFANLRAVRKRLAGWAHMSPRRVGREGRSLPDDRKTGATLPSASSGRGFASAQGGDAPFEDLKIHLSGADAGPPVIRAARGCFRHAQRSRRGVSAARLHEAEGER